MFLKMLRLEVYVVPPIRGYDLLVNFLFFSLLYSFISFWLVKQHFEKYTGTHPLKHHILSNVRKLHTKIKIKNDHISQTKVQNSLNALAADFIGTSL